jgi:hypothetical protein
LGRWRSPASQRNPTGPGNRREPFTRQTASKTGGILEGLPLRRDNLGIDAAVFRSGRGPETLDNRLHAKSCILLLGDVFFVSLYALIGDGSGRASHLTLFWFVFSGAMAGGTVAVVRAIDRAFD